MFGLTSTFGSSGVSTPSGTVTLTGVLVSTFVSGAATSSLLNKVGAANALQAKEATTNGKTMLNLIFDFYY